MLKNLQENFFPVSICELVMSHPQYPCRFFPFANIFSDSPFLQFLFYRRNTGMEKGEKITSVDIASQGCTITKDYLSCVILSLTIYEMKNKGTKTNVRKVIVSPVALNIYFLSVFCEN